MKRFVVPILLWSVFTPLMAQVVDFPEAKIRAESFFTLLDQCNGPLKSADVLPEVDPFMTFYGNSLSSLKSASQPPLPSFYIFNREDLPGFVIISAEAGIRSVIAWSDDQRICAINPELKVLLEQYAREIAWARQMNLTSEEWNMTDVESEAFLLGGTEWCQEPDPYNALCPVDPASGKRCPVGCVATAMAQLLYYYRYPRTGTGKLGYNSDYRYEFADFSKAEYKYEVMGDKPPYGDANPEVSELSYHSAVAVETVFFPGVSFSYIGQITVALENFFKYKKAVLREKPEYSWNDWKKIIIDEINHKRPVIYNAFDPLDPTIPGDPSGGHAFVVDGYNNKDQFHINWGWSGCSNGYYSLTLLKPEDCNNKYTFSEMHSMVTDIEPRDTFECLVSADRESLQYPVQGGSQTIKVSANAAFTVTASDPWISVNPASGTGNREIVVTTPLSTQYLQRRGTVTVTACNNSKIIPVIQEGTCVLSFSGSSVSFPDSGGNKRIRIESTGSWLAVPSESWITVIPAGGGGSDSISLSVPPYDGYGIRNGTVNINGCSTSKAIQVSQVGSCILSESVSSLVVKSKGDTVTVGIDTNTSWTAVAGVPWLSVSPSSGTGKGNLRITASANPDLSSRSGEVHLSGCGITKKIAVSQQGNCYLSVSPVKVNLPNSAGSTYVYVASNSPWSVTGHESWIYVTPKSGTAGGVVVISAAYHPGITPRTGKVTFTACDTEYEVTVEQRGSCVFELSATGCDFSYMSGSKSVNITTRTFWTAETDAPWISLSSNAGAGNSTFNVSVTANRDKTSRTGKVIINCCNFTRELLVTQGSCNLKISEEKLIFPAGSGSKNLQINSNTMWSIFYDADWLTVFPSIGTNNGQVTVTVGENLSVKRSAWLSFVGCFSPEKVEVTQEGIPTGIPEGLSHGCKVYPSPASRFVNVQLPLFRGDGRIQVYSASGRHVYARKISDRIEILDLKGFAPGIYIVAIDLGGELIREKIVLR